mmetsp:Transcript_16902/g.43211  ORF Transcript_16902/g.43211 Transcript_16902/m.43211 type:complete len:242 (-) Transcript_16902:232-957(-)
MLTICTPASPASAVAGSEAGSASGRGCVPLNSGCIRACVPLRMSSRSLIETIIQTDVTPSSAPPGALSASKKIEIPATAARKGIETATTMRAVLLAEQPNASSTSTSTRLASKGKHGKRFASASSRCIANASCKTSAVENTKSLPTLIGFHGTSSQSRRACGTCETKPASATQMSTATRGERPGKESTPSGHSSTSSPAGTLRSMATQHWQSAWSSTASHSSGPCRTSEWTSPSAPVRHSA